MAARRRASSVTPLRASITLLLLSACAPRTPAPAPVLQPQEYSSGQLEPRPLEAPTLQACADLDTQRCSGGVQPVCAESKTGGRTDYEDPCIACEDPEVVAWWPETCESLDERKEEP